jgi:hypothetical protein
MRVEVFPAHVTMVPGQPVLVAVQVLNTATVISAHKVRILGVDERWVELDTDQLSLFPETTGVVNATISLPEGIPAGTRRLTVQVVELTPPQRTATATIDLTVPEQLGARIAVDPVATTGGRRTEVAVHLANEGNTELALRLDGIDEEDRLSFRFDPREIVLAPGERLTATAELSARRPFAGSPKPRTYILRAWGTDPPIETFGSFVQKPLISRGMLSLLGLLAAITVFAAVLTASLNRVVDKSSADRDLLLQVIQGARETATGEASSVSGRVALLTSDAGVSGVTVQAFASGDTSTPVASTASGGDGAYTLADLGAGTYRLRFRGAGFTELWYPQSLTAEDAEPVELRAGQAVTDIDVVLGGVPAKVTGTVTGTDPAGATVSLRVPASTAAPPGSTVQPAATGTGAGTAAAGGGSDADPSDATIVSTRVAADGGFTLEQVPSPASYDLLVEKDGFATAVQRVNLGAGEERSGIEILLRKGDGAISGRILSAAGPLGGASIAASDGTSTATTVSLTGGDVGAFTLLNLPTPANLTLVVTHTDFATETLALSLAPAQELTGVSVTLSGGAGSISGEVTLAGGVPAGGVTVTASNGELTLQTVTLSTGAVGSYLIGGLPVPGTFTLTYARPDLASVTQAVDLDGFGDGPVRRDVTMRPATAIVEGTVSEVGGARLGEVEVVLTSGSSTFRTVTASAPAERAGDYFVAGIPPGTYSISFTRPGSKTTSTLVGLAAGDRRRIDAALEKQASITGVVSFMAGGTLQPLRGAEVRLYLIDQFPTVELRTALTNEAGAYVFASLEAPQTYIVEFAYPAGSTGQTSTTVPLLPGEARTGVGAVLQTGSAG